MHASLRYGGHEESAMTEGGRSNHAAANPLAGLGWVPFVVLAGACVVVMTNRPGAASPAGPLMGVQVVLLVSGFALAIFLEVMARMLVTRQRLATGYDASPQATRAILDATAGITRILNVALALFLAFLAAPLRGLAPVRALTLALAIPLGAIA